MQRPRFVRGGRFGGGRAVGAGGRHVAAAFGGRLAGGLAGRAVAAMGGPIGIAAAAGAAAADAIMYFAGPRDGARQGGDYARNGQGRVIEDYFDPNGGIIDLDRPRGRGIANEDVVIRGREAGIPDPDLDNAVPYDTRPAPRPKRRKPAVRRVHGANHAYDYVTAKYIYDPTIRSTGYRKMRSGSYFVRSRRYKRYRSSFGYGF